MSYMNLREIRTHETMFAQSQDAKWVKRHASFLEKLHLLKLSEKKELFSPAFETEEKEEIPVTYLKNTKSALKKLVKKTNETIFLIENGREGEKIFQNRVKEYTDYSPDIFFPVLEKIFCAYIKKKDAQIPLGEIYVLAPPPFACRIISLLYPYARLFTVISHEEYQGKMYDEIYFKHGTLIRQMEVFNNDVRGDCAVIRMSGEHVPLWIKCPVLDMGCQPQRAARSLIMKDIYITDDFLSETEKEWGGKAGAVLFSLLGKKPSENAKVNIGKKADKIFLLDTNAF